MKKMNLFLVFLLIPFFFAVNFAQTTGLPKFKNGEKYKSVRVKMIKAGWKPSPTSQGGKCCDGDERCQGRPEVEICAAAGALASCQFRWKRKGKAVIIWTTGESSANTVNGYKFQ